MAKESDKTVKETGGESPIRFENNDLDETLPPCRECERHFFAQTSTFNVFDAAIVLISMVTFAADIATDGLAASQYFVHGEPGWGCLTLGFILLPSIIIQVFSVRWYLSDEDMTGWRWIFHCVLIGPVERYVTVFETGMEARRSRDPLDFERLHHQQSDVCMLRLFESFLESAPQVVLQLYIMVATNDENLFTGIAGTVSLFSLCWAVVAYSRAHRRVRRDKNGISWPGAILQTIWRIGMISSRVVALVLFASAFKAYTFLVVGLHWLVMVAWVYFQHTDFCDSWLEERLFNCVIGTVYVFCFFNLKEGNTRYRIGIFYLIVAVENVALLLLWHRFGMLEDWYTFLGFIVVFGGFIVGVTTMVMYYRFFHPRGVISFCGKAQDHKNDVCQHGKSNRLSTLRRHGDMNAEIFHRSRTPSPQKNILDGQPGHNAEDLCSNKTGAPCKYSPPKIQLESMDWRTAPPLRSKSLGCLLTNESECQGITQLSGNIKPLDNLGEINNPSKPISLPCQNSPEPCTCSFQMYQLSGFATDLVDRFDKSKEKALTQSVLTNESKPLAHSLLANESKLSLYSAQSRTPCRACLKFESGRSNHIQSSKNRIRSFSQPNTPSVSREPKPARYEIHPNPQVTLHFASSVNTPQTPTSQNIEISETVNTMEISQVSVDLPQMPNYIDSPETAGKMSSYQVQKIYDQILGRQHAQRISKRQLRFDNDLDKDLDKDLNKDLDNDPDNDLDNGRVKVGSSLVSSAGGAAHNAEKLKSKSWKDYGVKITKRQQLLIPKTKASPGENKHQQKLSEANPPSPSRKPDDSESESRRDVSNVKLATSVEAKLSKNEKVGIPESIETVRNFNSESEDCIPCGGLTIPGKETNPVCSEVWKPSPSKQADVSSVPGKSTSIRSVLPKTERGKDVEGGSSSKSSADTTETSSEVAGKETGAEIPVFGKLSQDVQGAQDVTHHHDLIRDDYVESNPSPCNQTTACQAVYPVKPIQVLKVAQLREGDDRHFERAQINILVESANKNNQPASQRIINSPLSPRLANPKTKLGQNRDLGSGPGKENKSLTPLSARLALMSPSPNPSSPHKKPPRKSLGRIPTNLVAANVALFNN